MGIANIYGARENPPASGLVKIYDNTKDGDNVNYDYIDLQPDSMYLLVFTSVTSSTGRVFGHGARLVTTPDAEIHGTVAATNSSFAGTANTGITFQWPNTGQIQWRCGGAGYRVRVRVFKIN